MYQGRRNNDDYKYDYDKAFNLRDSENGGLQHEESADSHALDHSLDRGASYDRNVSIFFLSIQCHPAQKKQGLKGLRKCFRYIHTLLVTQEILIFTFIHFASFSVLLGYPVVTWQ